MKRLLLLGLALGIAACSPDIPTGSTNPAQFVEAEFDPANSVIPLPNDLLFLNTSTGQVGTTLNAPTTGSTAAQNEFNANYLNTLDGFPMESTASVLFSQPINLELGEAVRDPGANLLVFDITNQTNPQPVGNLSVTTSPAANDATVAEHHSHQRLLDPGPPLRRAGRRGSERHQGCELRADRDRFPDLVAGLRKRAGAGL